MSSPNFNEQLRLRGELSQISPRKLSALQTLQNGTSDTTFILDIEQISKEARAAGATEEQISRFFADSRRAQIKDLLADDSIFEKYLPPGLDEATRAERIRALRQAKEDEWYDGHDEYLRKRAQREAQSERDRSRRSTPNGTPTKERPSTPQSTPNSPTLGDSSPSRSQENKQRRLSRQKQSSAAKAASRNSSTEEYIQQQILVGQQRKAHRSRLSQSYLSEDVGSENGYGGDSPLQMSPTPSRTAPAPAPIHGPLVDRTRPAAATNMDPSKENGTGTQLTHENENNVKANGAAPPVESTNKTKKEKAPKQPKAPKAAPSAAPLTPAVIDLRVGHILRAVEHPNADTMYVSTIAMGDPEGAEHTEIDEQTGKVVRTVCSGLKAYVPLAEMQDRKIVVVANLKPANLRSIKSAAMVLAASPKPEEGADPHSPDRTVELVQPPEGSEAGDKVYFEGWPYGEGKGPEKQLNPKKKMWEALQPGFYTTDDLVVAFDASQSEMEDKSGKGELVVEGKGKCTVKSLKGAIVR